MPAQVPPHQPDRTPDQVPDPPRTDPRRPAPQAVRDPEPVRDGWDEEPAESPAAGVSGAVEAAHERDRNRDADGSRHEVLHRESARLDDVSDRRLGGVGLPVRVRDEGDRGVERRGRVDPRLAVGPTQYTLQPLQQVERLAVAVEDHRDRLREMHERIESQGCFVAHATRVLVEARKPGTR